MFYYLVYIAGYSFLSVWLKGDDTYIHILKEEWGFCKIYLSVIGFFVHAPAWFLLIPILFSMLWIKDYIKNILRSDVPWK
jgi:hypothetical protein